MDQATPLARGLDRRRFLMGTAGAVAGTTGVATALTWPTFAEAAPATVTAPEPIVSVLDPGLRYTSSFRVPRA